MCTKDNTIILFWVQLSHIFQLVGEARSFVRAMSKISLENFKNLSLSISLIVMPSHCLMLLLKDPSFSNVGSLVGQIILFLGPIKSVKGFTIQNESHI